MVCCRAIVAGLGAKYASFILLRVVTSLPAGRGSCALLMLRLRVLVRFGSPNALGRLLTVLRRVKRDVHCAD